MSQARLYRLGLVVMTECICELRIAIAAIFTVMCYNVLCDKYATRQLYGYCPSWALNWQHRRRHIFEEIHHYGADVISLQVTHPHPAVELKLGNILIVVYPAWIPSCQGCHLKRPCLPSAWNSLSSSSSIRSRQPLNCLALRPPIGPNALPLIKQLAIEIS